MKILFAVIIIFSAGSFVVADDVGKTMISPSEIAIFQDGKDTDALLPLVAQENPAAIIALGQVGDADACKTLKAPLSSDNPTARGAAARAIGLCGDVSLAAWLRYQLKREDTPAIRDEIAYALGRLELERDREILITLVNNGASDRVIHGLLQSITYKSLAASDLSALNFDLLASKIAAEPKGKASVAAYLLARLGGLSRVLDFSKLDAAIRATNSSHARILLIPAYASYGGPSLAYLQELSASPDQNIRAAVAVALVGLGNPLVMDQVTALAKDEASQVRQALSSAITSRETINEDLLKIIVGMAKDESPWVRITAIGGLYRHQNNVGIQHARTALASDNLYLKAGAARLLGDDPESKPIIEAMAANDEEPYLQGAAKTGLSIEQTASGDNPRKTDDWEYVFEAISKSIVMQTNRGVIEIALSPDTPFASWNFYQLASYGYFDGMIWHRVIPNFVAQAGARNDELGERWGTIREEWGGTHKPYSVGVATSGRDTGSMQFFINTRHNLHLDDRYTVFGEVIRGFDIVDMLEEGDVIITANTVSAADRSLAE